MVVEEAIHDPDPFTPEEFARDYQVPLEAILEALDYVAKNRPLIGSSSKSETARPPGSAPEGSSIQRRNKIPDKGSEKDGMSRA